LNRFPFETIKIDRELVRGCGTASGAAIMRSMVALAHELSKTVVAEGVERADEATFLRSIGCEYAQGYHFGEPIPERAVSQLLKMVRRSERKMQPRGFFRPKIAAKPISARVPRPAAASQSKLAAAEQHMAAANGSAKSTALPTGAIVRQRKARSAANGAAKPAASPAPALKKSADGLLRDVVTAGGPASRPTARPTVSPEMLANVDAMAPPPMQRPHVNGHAAPPSMLPPPNPQHTFNDTRQNIVSPLAEALQRAANTPPPRTMPLPPAPQQQRAAPPPATHLVGTPIGATNGASVAPPVIPPAAPPIAATVSESPPVRSSPPPPPPPPQPDFSTLPPSIAKSLARLAGGVPPANGANDVASTETPKAEQTLAPKAAGSGSV
jgi:hypothetical protein